MSGFDVKNAHVEQTSRCAEAPFKRCRWAAVDHQLLLGTVKPHDDQRLVRLLVVGQHEIS